jgi:hypothetical protein
MMHRKHRRNERDHRPHPERRMGVYIRQPRSRQHAPMFRAFDLYAGRKARLSE